MALVAPKAPFVAWGVPMGFFAVLVALKGRFAKLGALMAPFVALALKGLFVAPRACRQFDEAGEIG